MSKFKEELHEGTMVILALRTVILYLVVVIALRLMGKREIGQLQPFELVVILMISDLAAVPSEDVGIPLFSGIVPIMVLVLMSISLSYVELKSERARDILNGKPSILIERGRIVEHELIRNRLTLTDLVEELRMQSIPNINDVEFAILETNGQISVLPKANKRPVTPEDLKLQPSYEGLPCVFIMDGRLQKEAFVRTGKSEVWLKNQLKKHNLNSVKEVLLASMDSSGNVYLQPKAKYGNKNKQSKDQSKKSNSSN